MRRYLSRILIALFTLLILTCRSGCKQSTAGEGGERLTLKVGIMPSVDHLPLAIAKAQGFTDSVGLDIEFVRFYSPMERDVALQTQQIDGAVTDLTSFLIQSAKGLPYEMPLALEGRFYLVVRPEIAYKSLGDLEGKRFALSTNTVIEYATDRLMGARPYTRVEVQKLPLRIEMLQQGEVDAAILPEPFASLARSRGMQVVEDVLGLDAPLPITGLTLSSECMGREELQTRLYKAYDLAVEYLDTHAPEAWLLSVVEHLGLEEAILSQIRFGRYSPAHAPKAEDVEEAKAWLKAKSLL